MLEFYPDELYKLYKNIYTVLCFQMESAYGTKGIEKDSEKTQRW